MADDLHQLDAWCEELLSRISPASRAALARQIAAGLRKANRARIAAQVNPDGSAYAPRAPRVARNKGRIKRRMFAKISRSYLDSRSNNESAIVELSGKVQRIGRVHHYGLRDRVTARGPEYQYPARQLLGISDADADLVKTLVIDRLIR